MADETPTAEEPRTRNRGRQFGRTPALTPEVEAALLRCISIGDSDGNACAVAGIAPNTFYQWMQKGRDGKGSLYVDFAQKVTRARAECRRNLIAVITAAAAGGQGRDPDWKAARFLLSVRHPEEYSERVISGKRLLSAVRDAKLGEIKPVAGSEDSALTAEEAAVFAVLTAGSER